MNQDHTTGSPEVQAAPAVTLGRGFAPAEFQPGRYATAVQRTMHGTHALQVLSEDSTASLVLDFAGDGTATACRGWRYQFRNAGPTVNTEDRYREQQGYRGHYQVVAGVAEVVLAVDNAVCPHLFEGQLALARAPSVTLRCVLATPDEQQPGALTTPVLLCQPQGTQPTELEPYTVEQIAPTGWFALGTGNGLRVWLTGRAPGAQVGDEVRVRTEPAEQPVPETAWQQAF